jgi:hypothetical protein
LAARTIRVSEVVFAGWLRISGMKRVRIFGTDRERLAKRPRAREYPSISLSI